METKEIPGEKERALIGNVGMQLGMLGEGIKTHDQTLATIIGFAVKYAQDQTASLRKEIEERDKEIERLKGLADGKAAGWISVKDRLPEVGDNVLMILRGARQQVIPGYYGHNNGFYAWGTNILEHDSVKVLYWITFPSPPSDHSQE